VEDYFELDPLEFASPLDAEELVETAAKGGSGFEVDGEAEMVDLLSVENRDCVL